MEDIAFPGGVEGVSLGGVGSEDGGVAPAVFGQAAGDLLPRGTRGPAVEKGFGGFVVRLHGRAGRREEDGMRIGGIDGDAPDVAVIQSVEMNG